MGVAKYVWVCPKLCQIVSQFHLKNELSYKDVFLASGYESINVTNLFNHFK